MSHEKEWLDASIHRWERVKEHAEKRLKLYRDLRKELDVDFVDLRRLVEEDSPAIQATEDKPQANRVEDESFANVKRDIKVDGEARGEKIVGEKTPQLIRQMIRQNKRQGIRGERNPNRLLILELTTEEALTLPQIHRELKERGQHISKQAVFNWVKKLRGDGLLELVPSSDPASKNAYKRTGKLDVVQGRALWEIQGDRDQAGENRQTQISPLPPAKGPAIVRNGLRQWIRDAVVESSHGLKSTEIARRIEAKGFASNATTPLAIRVRNEAYRMVKQGDLKKRAGKFYPPTNKAEGQI